MSDDTDQRPVVRARVCEVCGPVMGGRNSWHVKLYGPNKADCAAIYWTGDTEDYRLRGRVALAVAAVNALPWLLREAEGGE